MAATEQEVNILRLQTKDVFTYSTDSSFIDKQGLTASSLNDFSR